MSVSIVREIATAGRSRRGSRLVVRPIETYMTLPNPVFHLHQLDGSWTDSGSVPMHDRVRDGSERTSANGSDTGDMG